MLMKQMKRLRSTAISSVLTVLILTTASVSQPAVANQYSPNFKGADINEFVNIVGKILGKTIIIDPSVKGKINVRSYDLVTKEQYYHLFLNVLEVYGFAVIDMGNDILKVVRLKDTKTSPTPVVGDNNPGEGDEMVTRVVQVKNVSVRDLAPLLRQLSDQSGSGHVVNYDPSNVIMLVGSAAAVQRLVKVINLVDRAGDQKIEIINLEFASAGEVVRILDSIYKSSTGKKDQPEFLIPKIVADDRTNSVIVTGEPKAREKVIDLIKRLDSELQSTGNAKVHYLKYAKAEDVVKVLTGVSDSLAKDKAAGTKTSTASRSRSSARDYSIQAHPDTNSLVINAEPDMMRSLEQIIRQLDVRRSQVLVEAIIVEVFESNGINLGIQWGSEDYGFTQFNNGGASLTRIAGAGRLAQDRDVTEPITTTNADGGVTIQNGTRTELGDNGAALAQVLSSATGFVTGFVDDGWGAVLQAVRSDVNSNILATPSLTTLDNEEASILVGSEVPILTGSTAGANNGNPFQTVERQEVGIKLNITPQINEGSAVQLLIEQEVSNVSGVTAQGVNIDKRNIKTTVLAEDGGTIVIGGLIDEDVQEEVQKVPLLGDIPIIGHLFRSTATSKRKRNLMVFIRPTIVRDRSKLLEVSKNKYNFLRAKQLEAADEGISLMPFTDQPVADEWKDDLELPPTFEEYIEKEGKQSSSSEQSAEKQANTEGAN